MNAIESTRPLKRKAPKNCPFKVIREVTNAKKQKYSLQILKPDAASNVVGITYPSVYLKKERVDNHRALYIMHNLNHSNILHMKSVAPSKNETNDPLSVMAFVEPYDGLLWVKFDTTSKCVDKLQQIPNPELRGFLRGVVIGMDYLWQRELYHGNLSWDSTLYYQMTTKLAGFQDLKISIDEARWKDVESFIIMLEVIAARASIENKKLLPEQRCFYGELTSLINLLKTLRQQVRYTCLYSSLKVLFIQSNLINLFRIPFKKWKEIILKNAFFWNLAEKVNFFANDVSLLLSNGQFMETVRRSPPCRGDWDKNCTNGFKVLMKAMNDYRESLKRKRRGSTSGEPNDGKKAEDYVRCVCGAFTHWKQIKMDVDFIVRENHPTICSDFKHLVETSINLVQNKVPIQSGPSSFNQHDMSKVIAPGRQKEKQKQQWVVKAKNKMPSLSGSFSDLVERDVSEPTAVGKTSKLISEEGKEQEKKECTAKFY